MKIEMPTHTEYKKTQDYLLEEIVRYFKGSDEDKERLATVVHTLIQIERMAQSEMEYEALKERMFKPIKFVLPRMFGEDYKPNSETSSDKRSK